MNKADWFTFQPGDEEATVHASYRLAIRDAQYRGDTEKRPKRLTAGHYEVIGCGGHQYYVVAQPLMAKNYPDLMRQAYEAAA